MAEVAGLVLGGIPLVVSAVDIFAVPLESYKDYKKKVSQFHCQLVFQKRSLEETLLSIGLKHPTKDEVRECINSKFPTTADEIFFIYESIEEETGKLMRRLGIDRHTKFDEIRTASPIDLRRIWNSISVKRREKTIRSLRELNEQLCFHLQTGTCEVKAEDDNVIVEGLIRRFNIQKSNALRLCLASLHRALSSSFICACAVPHQAALDIDWHVDRTPISSSPDIKLAVSYQSPDDNRNAQQSEPGWLRLYATQKSAASAVQPSGSSPSASHSITPRRTPSPLWLWLSRTKVGQPDSTRPRSLIVPQPEMHVSLAPSTQTPTPTPLPVVTNLCGILSSNMSEHMLKDADPDYGSDFCVCNNVAGAKITYLAPVATALNPPQDHQKLSLKARCGLALCAALSVLHLSSGPWLSKDWDGSGIGIFFEKPDHNPEKLADSLCFLYNSLSLPSAPLVTKDEDKHTNITAFALGILLVELCLGKAFAESQQQQPTTSIKSRYEFANNNLDKVYDLAGGSYGDAAKRCIRFSFPDRDASNIFEVEQFRVTFYRQVVAPVEATYRRLCT